MTEEPSRRDQLAALFRVAQFRPLLTVGIMGFSVFAAVLEGIGLSFLLPILEQAQSNNTPMDSDGLMGAFVTLYKIVNVPFTLEYIIAGVGLVMCVRFTSSFVVAWCKSILKTTYTRHLRLITFQKAVEADVEYFDEAGSDEILNVIVTQTDYAGRLIEYLVRFTEQGLLSLMYLFVAFYISPFLTILTVVVLGVFMLLFRTVLETGYSLGDKIAQANEQVQETAQAGTQGIRDVKLFGLVPELSADFRAALDQYTRSTIRLGRNKSAMQNFYQLVTALVVFGLIYVALTFARLSLASLGVFLFAMFRLAPRVSSLNNQLYQIEGDLPHLVRTQSFCDELDRHREPDGGETSPPDTVGELAYESVSFTYESVDETVLDDVSFSFEHGQFVAFVGPSGAGKSTIVSLLTRMYDPDEGEILADGQPIDTFPIEEWRSNVAVVRQNPYIFNDTLEYNVTLGNRDASRAEIETACEIAQVTEFLDEMPDGYETILGDDGVRLSGGQRQRIAIARAILKDADIVVLDEATSDLDSGIEETVHSGIESLSGERTLLVIAHRLSTVVNADRIYTMEDGRITEMGTHRELVEDNGKYADLFEKQSY